MEDKNNCMYENRAQDDFFSSKIKNEMLESLKYCSRYYHYFIEQ